jgi:hypothetical protein
MALLAQEMHVAKNCELAGLNPEELTNSLGRYAAASTDASGETADENLLTERLAHYRVIVAAIERFSSVEYAPC